MYYRRNVGQDLDAPRQPAAPQRPIESTPASEAAAKLDQFGQSSSNNFYAPEPTKPYEFFPGQSAIMKDMDKRIAAAKRDATLKRAKADYEKIESDEKAKLATKAKSDEAQKIMAKPTADKVAALSAPRIDYGARFGQGAKIGAIVGAVSAFAYGWMVVRSHAIPFTAAQAARTSWLQQHPLATGLGIIGTSILAGGAINSAVGFGEKK